MNDSIIRVKKGEMYQQTLQLKNQVSTELELDIGGAEVRLPKANINKVTDSEAKLLRERESIPDSLNNIRSGDICFSWIVQILGLRAYFSTVAFVGHDLYVSVLQNQIVFPSCIGELNDTTKSLLFFETHFQFRDVIEDSTHIIQAKIT